MEQVLTRRFRRYLDGDEKFVEKPDLLLIDGGLEHVRVARRVLEAMALDIPAFGKMCIRDRQWRTWTKRAGTGSNSIRPPCRHGDRAGVCGARPAGVGKKYRERGPGLVNRRLL